MVKEVTIIAVDDEPANLFLLNEILQEYTLITLQNSELAIQLIKKHVPDLVLLDIMMPKVDGFDIAHEMINDGVLRSIPIIFISARDSGEDVSKGLSIGAQDYIKKPYNEVEVLARIKRVLQMNSERKELYYLATRDQLTGLYNRNYFFEAIQIKMGMANRKKHKFSVAIIDLDHFKQVNDTYGHQVGDSVLINFASTISSSCRDYDIVARYGGEEFIVYFGELLKEEACEVMDRIRQRVENMVLEKNNNIRITFSAGIADISVLEGSNGNLETIIQKADECLYRAKDEGRNRVIIQG